MFSLYKRDNLKVHDNWSTPIWVKEFVEDNFGCTMTEENDPCPLKEKPVVDGMAIDWKDNIFVNPPYSQLHKAKGHKFGWVQKGLNEWLKGNNLVMLLPFNTSVGWFRDIIYKWMKRNPGLIRIYVFKRNLKFGESKRPASFPSMLVVLFQEPISRKRGVGKICYLLDIL